MFNVSGNAPELDDGQVLAAGVVGDHEHDFLARLTIDGCCRCCTRSAGWPAWPGFDARHLVCGRTVVVHLVGRSAAEELVRPMLVVPVETESQLPPHVIAPQRDGDATRALVFERPEDAFDHSATAVLSDGAKARPDAFAFAPGLEAVTPELWALVADDVLRLGPGVEAAEEGRCSGQSPGTC